MSKQSIVLIVGFESFNTGLYRQVAHLVKTRCPDLELQVFSDRDITANPTNIATALESAQVFFGSLIFDYDQVMWLRDRIQHIPMRLVFESALELMSMTQLGAFAIGDKSKGMPKPIKFILDKLNLGAKGREEDRIAGYLNFLKTGPQLLRFIPIEKVQDLRNWLIIYGYWNAGGLDNVAALFWTIAEKYLGLKVGEIPAVLETPNMGLLHPDYQGYFTSPRQYLEWYQGRRQDRQNVDPHNSHAPIVGILLYRKHVITKQNYIPQLIRYFEQAGLIPLPIFINGVEGHIAVRDWLTTAHERELPSHIPAREPVEVDAIVSTIGFTLVGGPAGSMEGGRKAQVTQEILNAKNVPYIVAAPLLIQDIHSWTRQGIGGLQSIVLYALPELDGAIDTVPLGGLVGEDIYLIPERVHRLIGRLKNWIELRHTPVAERRIAIILYGFPPGYGAVGTAALLNVPRSLMKLLHTLKEQGYTVGDLNDLPEDGEELIRQVKTADDLPYAVAGKSVKAGTLETWLGYLRTTWIEKQWKSLTASGIKTYGDEFLIGGVQLGNVWIGVQPPLGIAGDPMRLMFERDLTPHPQYAAFYKWLQCEFRAHAVVHFGMHGTVEWLPGSPLGNTGYSWSDILLGNLPNLYIYAANNPSESILAKRRGYGVLISHNVPPYGRAGLYKELITLRDIISEYREDPDKNYALKEAICKKITDTGLQADCPFEEAKRMGLDFTYANLRMFGEDTFNRYLIKLYAYLQELESRLFSSGLHILGSVPTPELVESYLNAYFGDDLPAEVTSAIASGVDLITAEAIALKSLKLLSQNTSNGQSSIPTERLDEAIQIRELLAQTGNEIDNLLRGLNGEYIPPAPGGDLLRDGPGVLPTGRNIHALDPYRMPSLAAYTRGKAIAQQILSQHLKECGSYPETIAVMLWGLDAIKTKGESLGILLELVGAEPVKEGTGRIVRYELRSLSEIGHPRIDVLANLSGIFRDSFGNILELLDDLFQRAADIEEPIDQNFIRKHALALRSQGVDNVSARLFSNPAGDFGSLVNDRIVDANWESADELAQTWRDRNAFSYGRQDRGKARPEVLTQLLQTTGRIVQEIDSVEYGLTDIQEYYANTGGLKQAAEIQQRSDDGKNTPVRSSFVESFSKDIASHNLEDLLRMEYRTKLLNPKWAEAMANQGSGGAFEISQRMTALIGWGGTVRFKDAWVYDQASDTYALDPEMAKKLRESNPEAFRNIVGRMLEANGRGFWHPDEEKLEKLRALYAESEDALEGLTSVC